MNWRQFWLTFWMLILGSVMCAPGAHAAGRGIDRATGQALWDAAVNGKTTTIGIGAGAMKVIGPAGTSATTGAGATMAAAATDTVQATVAGKVIPVTVASSVPKGVIADVVTGCLTGSFAGYLGCAIGAATPLALNWIANAGVQADPANPGQYQYKPTGPGYCYTGPCYAYMASPMPANSWVRDGIPACNAWIAVYTTAYPANAPYTFKSWTDSSATCLASNKTGGQVGTIMQRQSVSPLSPTWYPATPQNIRDSLYNNDPPAPIVDELAKYGNIIWPGASINPTVSGPASVPGPKTVTNNPDGSTTTKQDQTNYSYSGPSVTSTGTTTTTTTKAPDGTTTSTTTSTTTDTSTDAPKSDEGTPTDTPLPEIPSLYTPKFPNGMTGVWADRKAALMSSPLMSMTSQLLPSLGSGGSCPTMVVDLTFSGWADFGPHDVAPPCWVWDFGKVVVILSAMFLARALIFGG